MLKNFAIFILITTITTIVACSDSDRIYTLSSSAVVTSFSLATNDNVLVNLDSIYFSIDQVQALIYNADSLPYGTKTDKLIANIGILSCSVAELHIPNVEEDSDSIIDYLTNPTDSIDFSKGSVTLHVVAVDGQTYQDYSISVNVHQIEPDSLYWNELARQNLPSIFDKPTEQKTVEYNNQAVCLTSLDANYCIATSSDPGNGEWEKNQVYFQFTPDVNSFAATNDALYILDSQGALYTSTDGSSWNSCDVTWSHIYGGYENRLLGVEYESGKYYHVTYPSSTMTLVNDECPISGTSQLVTFENIWNVTPQVVMIGGKLSDGNLTGDTWGYDGFTWAKLNTSSFTAKEKMTLFPYFSYQTNTNNWVVTKYTTLVALGGIDAIPKTHKEVYISLDQGLNWKLADELLQLPDYIPAMADVQALIFSTTLQSRASSSSEWESFAPKSLPRWWIIEEPSTRATTPITDWDCPYIYLFGGTDANGTLYNIIWRGVINRLSFKPIQ